MQRRQAIGYSLVLEEFRFFAAPETAIPGHQTMWLPPKMKSLAWRFAPTTLFNRIVS